MIIDAVKSANVPVTGFIIGSNVNPNNWKALERFKEEGLGLGNHTWSHANIHNLSAEEYI